MSAAEILAMMTPHGVNVDHIPGGIPSLTGVDVAGACGMAKLTKLEYHLILAKYCGDANALHLLSYEVWMLTADMANKYGWKPVRGKPYLRAMSEIAIAEVIADHRCNGCNGTGLNDRSKACCHCSGSGVDRLPKGGYVEKKYGLPSDVWRKTWRFRFPVVVSELQRCEGSAMVKITNAIRR